MHLHVVPLAVTMVAGPQILTAILRLTGPRPVRPSAAYLSGIVVASGVTTAAIMLVVHLVDHRTGFSQSGGQPSRATHVVQAVLIGLLVLLAIKTWRGRDRITQPKWMGAMQEAGAKRCFNVGFLLIVLMPGDVIAMSVVALYLVSHSLAFYDAAPFLVATWLLAALPLLTYLTFRGPAERTMPRVRDWMQNNAWAVNLAMYAVFVLLIVD